jgi:hypothetical protein
MTPATKFICENIDTTNLTPFDLLSDGIIEATFLELYHPQLYKSLSLGGFLKEIKSYEVRRVKLFTEEKIFIQEFINLGDAEIPSVRAESAKFFQSLVTFLNQVVQPICDQLLFGISEIDQEFDGEAQSTKNRNGGLSGPDRRPDVMMSKIYDQLKAEMVFVEVSYGPYSRDENHYRADKVRLGKFSKDAWRHIQAYFERFKCPEALRRLNELEHFSIHFHGTRMDVYVSDRKLAPFHRMCLIQSLEIPLTNENPSSTIKTVTEPNNSTI